MAIFTQLTSTLFIISMVIAITNGMMASGSCNKYYGKLEHDGEPKQMAANEIGKANTLQVSGPERFNECSVKMQVGDKECIAKNNQKVSCPITGGKLEGNLIFTIPNGKKIYIPFKNAQFFSGNSCDIQLGEYDY